MNRAKNLILTVLVVFLTFVRSSAQTYILYGDKTFGGNKMEHKVSIIHTGNNELILSGRSLSNINGDKTDPLCDSLNINEADIWMLKIDTGFNIIWDRSIGGQRGEREPSVLLKTSNNQIIISCASGSDSICDKTENNRSYPVSQNDYWICAVDSLGNKMWDKTFGGINPESNCQLIQLESGNLIAAGASNSPISADKTLAPYAGSEDYWIVKFDSLGIKLWDNVYGGIFQEVSNGDEQGYYYGIYPLEEDAFILGGTTLSPQGNDISDTSRGQQDIWIIKVDSNGTKVWDKRFGGIDDDTFSRIISTKDNGFIICGFTNSPQGYDITDTAKGITDSWIIKLDSLGNKQWDKRYGNTNGSTAKWIEEAPGGGYWISGQVFGPAGVDVTEPPYGTQGDYWIFKIDSIGNKIWDKRFGGPRLNFGSCFVIMPDSSIFLFGSADTGISAVKTDYGQGGRDYWLVHFKYTDNSVGTSSQPHQSNPFSIYPNPTKGIINLKSDLTGAATLTVSNVVGEKIYTNIITLQKQNTLNFSSLPSGMYFLNLQSSQFSNTIRFVKQ